MSPRRTSLILMVILVAFGVWWFRGPLFGPEAASRGGDGITRVTIVAPASSSPDSPAVGGLGGARAPQGGGGGEPSIPLTPEILARDYPIAARLNTNNSNIAGDLEILQAVLEAWRTNFPRDGNPVGENADITAALTGDNRLGLKLIPPNHPAINRSGELCDRWGTPFRFHQLSGQHMELRSAGPDRRFATPDDTVLSPPGP